MREKSGDSKLQDAAAARLENARDPKNSSVEQLPAILQDSVERKAAAGEGPEALEQANAMLEKLTRVVEGLNARIRTLEAKPASNLVQPAGSPLKKVVCGSCRQSMTVCGGKHATVRVWPTNEDFAPFFDGVKLNGVKYRGTCVVAVSQLNELAAALSAFEVGERNRHIQRGKTRGGDRGGPGKSLSTALSDLVSP